MSLGSMDIKTEIKSVDCQESLTGSILVLVTGSQSHPSWEQPRFFVQSFFLVPQEHGYFVNNDIFRFTDDAPQPVQPAVEKHAVLGGSAVEAADAAGGTGGALGLPNGEVGYEGQHIGECLPFPFSFPFPLQLMLVVSSLSLLRDLCRLTSAR